ncbi:hypothetical protein ABZS98_27965 [Streptomyces avermitilis]|uniref:hypothetical protein n=1 Tax=Streptomyces avermitilis TaxID=33903 RepID=UPI0033A22F20
MRVLRSQPAPLPPEITGLNTLAGTVASYIADGALRRELYPPAKVKAVEAG